MVERDRDYTSYVTAQLPWMRKLAYLLTQDWHRADDRARWWCVRSSASGGGGGRGFG